MLTNKMLFIFIIVSFSIIDSEVLGLFNVCPRNWKEFKILNSTQVKCIKPFYEMVWRDEAQRRCQQMGIGYDLIEIHSMFENDIIVFLLAEKVFSLNDRNDDVFNNYKPQVWIGAKRVPFGGIKDFQYRSGCGIKDFDFWHIGQPNDHYNNEDCVFMMIDDYFMGQWVDYNCNVKMYYMCQFVTDLKAPCNQTNFNLFGFNETNIEIHKINAENGKTNSTFNDQSKRNTTQNSMDRQPKTPVINIFNPFELINNWLNGFTRVL